MAMAVTSTSHSSYYHVFLSFRGPDTRYGFTGNLYKALVDKGIHTFFDDEKLRSGEQITAALENAIQESKIAIIVLSRDYASSSFCLHELSIIIDCAQSKGMLVIPVFYKVDPSHVRHQRGSYKDVLTKHERRFPDKLQKWKKALHKVADLSGYHFEEGNIYEYKFIGRIVDTVSSQINRLANLHVGDYLVGLESRVQELMKLLDVGSNNVVHMVGIHGMGGIGKSTLARAVYNKLIAEKFDGSCYLQNVKEESEKHGLKHLQQILLRGILGDKEINVTSVEGGAWMIAERLQRKKVLLVLDDVDKLQQLKAIVGSPKWFGPGSRVIITSRDRQPLACHQVKRIYEVKTLNYFDARQLLTWKAFQKEKADPTYENVLNRVLTYVSGLPLALEVIGSHLCGISVERWESAIEYYKRNSAEGIQGILEVSFLALEDDLKSVFLDIACCLRGYSLTEVECILNALYDLDMKYPIEVLVQKSLIKVDRIGIVDRVEMHDLIQDISRQIDLKKSYKKPEKCKRLWFWKDIIEVLKHKKGTSKIEIIYLDVPVSDREEIIDWDGNGFRKMKNLKILIIKNAKFSEGPKCLPNSLRVLEWWGYPSNCLPSDFQPHKFVICNLPDGCLTPFELDHSSKVFNNLTVLKLNGCKSLTQIPDMSDFSNLEILSFNLCNNLVTVHESIGHLGKLKHLRARGCRNLVSFPPIHLTSLEFLDLSETRLESFPEISGKMESIRTLHLYDTPIKEVPISFVNLIRLQRLSMYECGSVVKLPGSILMMPELNEFSTQGYKGIKWVKEEENEETMDSILSSKISRLDVPWCNLNDDFFSKGFTRFVDVTYLNLSGNNFTFTPECIKEFQSLEIFSVSDCKHLQEIRGVPPNLGAFYAVNCKSLSSTTSRMMINKERNEAGWRRYILPGAWIPGWFDHQSNGPSTSFWFRNEVPADFYWFIITPSLLSTNRCLCTLAWMNGKHLYSSGEIWLDTGRMEMDHTIIFSLRMEYDKVDLEEGWNHVEVRVKPVCKAIGIHVFTSSKDDIRFTDPSRKRKLEEVQNPFKLENNGPVAKRPRFL